MKSDKFPGSVQVWARYSTLQLRYLPESYRKWVIIGTFTPNTDSHGWGWVNDKLSQKSNIDFQGMNLLPLQSLPTCHILFPGRRYVPYTYSRIQHRFSGSGIWLINSLQNPIFFSRVRDTCHITDTFIPKANTDFQGGSKTNTFTPKSNIDCQGVVYECIYRYLLPNATQIFKECVMTDTFTSKYNTDFQGVDDNW